MNRSGVSRVAVLFGILAIVSLSFVGLAQDVPGEPPEGERPAQIDLFGGAAFEGGYLKFTYGVSREGVAGSSTTTTEIQPLPSGLYQINCSSTDVVPLDRVTISFFGIALRGLGFRVPTSTGGTVDLSPLSAIEDEVLEPNRDYVLPDGGYLVAEEAGVIAGIDVVYATYTHADYGNVEIHLAFPIDLTIRNLLPLFPYLELEYEAEEEAADGPADGDEVQPTFRSYSRIELTEFVYEP